MVLNRPERSNSSIELAPLVGVAERDNNLLLLGYLRARACSSLVGFAI